MEWRGVIGSDRIRADPSGERRTRRRRGDGAEFTHNTTYRTSRITEYASRRRRRRRNVREYRAERNRMEEENGSGVGGRRTEAAAERPESGERRIAHAMVAQTRAIRVGAVARRLRRRLDRRGAAVQQKPRREEEMENEKSAERCCGGGLRWPHLFAMYRTSCDRTENRIESKRIESSRQEQIERTVEDWCARDW